MLKYLYDSNNINKVLRLRGKETLVICEQCGRKVPRNKGVMFEKAISFNTGMQNTNDVRFFERRKTWYCISCAKHRGIFEKKKRQAIDRANKQQM